MQKYSAHNQAFLLSQNPDATDVRSFKEWQQAGRSVKKGEKSLKVWVPKTKTETMPTDVEGMDVETKSLYFRMGSVFDISQTEPAEEFTKRQEARKAKKAAAIA